MKALILIMIAVVGSACSNGGKVEGKTKGQKKSTPAVKKRSPIPITHSCKHIQDVPLIIDPDKVNDYLADEMDTVNVYDVVEQMPNFPGGPVKMFEFIEKNIQYPKTCAEKEIQGRVIISFIVEKNGALSNIRVVKSVHPDFDREALRIVKLMPKWVPGQQNGQKYRVKYCIPITFR